jgi:subtilisin family serine protease
VETTGGTNIRRKIVGTSICILMIVAVIIPATGTIHHGNLFDDKPSMEFVPGEFILKLKKDVTFSDSTLQILAEKYHVYGIEKVFPSSEGTLLDNIYLLHVPLNSDILSIVEDYSLCSEVVYVEPNSIARLCSIPNDSFFDLQWSLHNTGQILWNNISGIPDADIDAPEAWDIEIGSRDVVIAIIDTGIDYTHPDLAEKIWNNTDEIPGNGIDDDGNGYIDDIRGWYFLSNNSNITDGYGHGTMCTGIAAASTNNGIGIAGVGRNCTFMPLRVATQSGSTTAEDCAKAIQYAADNDADVISMSFGFSIFITILKDAVDYAYSKGVFLCAAAGNANSSAMLYPAGFENVTAVAATDQNDQRCTWGPGSGSNYGDWVDIAAPGNLIITSTPTYDFYMEIYGWTQNYGIGHGTSFSSPIVAGAAALLLSMNPLLEPDIIKLLLCNNVDPYNSTEYIGTGRINAYKALDALVQIQPIADFTWTPQNPLTNQSVTFDASASQDPNGTIVLYEWDWESDGVFDESHTTPTATHAWNDPGNYTITLQVTDDHGIRNTKAKTVIVNQHPPDNPTITGPEQGKPGNTYKYTITGTDPESDMVSAYIQWGDDTMTNWTAFHNSG